MAKRAINLTVEIDDNNEKLVDAYESVLCSDDEDNEQIFDILEEAVRRELIALANKA